MKSIITKFLSVASAVVIGCSAVGSSAAVSFDYVVLDPGHTPRTPGAISAGNAPEHGFNNVFVRELAQALELEQIPYLISNVKNAELSLTDRVKNTGKRALFISIHHDSVQPQYCNLNTSPCRTDYASGYSLFVSKVNRNFRISKEIASKIARSLRQSGLSPSVHHGEKIPNESKILLDHNGVYQYDNLVVLKNASSPAILIEVAVITNPQDERLARNPRHRAKIIKAIVKTLREYIGFER